MLLGLLLRRRRVPAGRIQRARRSRATRASSTSCTSRPYFQDDWRVNSKLTLNLGLRWDYRNVPYETQQPHGVAQPRTMRRAACWWPTSRWSTAASWTARYYQLADRRSPENPDRFKVFAPRLGFAWRPFEDGKTVVRGGYGVFFDSAEGREIDGAADVYPYVSRGNYQQSVGQVDAAADDGRAVPELRGARRGDAGGQHLPRRQPVAAAAESVRAAMVARRAARGVPAARSLELNYIGNKGTNLLMRRNIAQALPYDPAHPSRRGAQAVPELRRLHRQRLERPVELQRASTPSWSTAARGALLTFAYTWAKSTDTKSAAAGIGATGFNGWQGFLDNHDPERDHGLSDFDVDHRLVGSFVYNLPFGNGETYRRRCDGRQGSAGRRLAGERHLHLAARVPAHRSPPPISAA